MDTKPDPIEEARRALMRCLLSCAAAAARDLELQACGLAAAAKRCRRWPE